MRSISAGSVVERINSRRPLNPFVYFYARLAHAPNVRHFICTECQPMALVSICDELSRRFSTGLVDVAAPIVVRHPPNRRACKYFCARSSATEQTITSGFAQEIAGMA